LVRNDFRAASVLILTLRLLSPEICRLLLQGEVDMRRVDMRAVDMRRVDMRREA
jgi:hypothetical protein